jgi:outer membrane protein, porin F
MKKPTLVAVSSIVAMAVPTVSEKITTSDMRKDIIRANVADIQQDVKNDVPTLDTPNPQKTVSAEENPDLITVTLTQDGTGTQIVDKKTSTPIAAPEKTEQKSSIVPQQDPTVTSVQSEQISSDIQKNPINNPERVEISKSEIITLRTNDLSFHKNSVDINKEAYSVLRDIKDYIENNDFIVSIIGYTDARGASSYNKRLSLRRAEKVSSKLIELGLSKDRILDIIGRGESNPIKTNDTEEGREGNRRVEFRFLKKGQV